MLVLFTPLIITSRLLALFVKAKLFTYCGESTRSHDVCATNKAGYANALLHDVDVVVHVVDGATSSCKLHSHHTQSDVSHDLNLSARTACGR